MNKSKISKKKLKSKVANSKNNKEKEKEKNKEKVENKKNTFDKIDPKSTSFLSLVLSLRPIQLISNLLIFYFFFGSLVPNKYSRINYKKTLVCSIIGFLFAIYYEYGIPGTNSKKNKKNIFLFYGGHYIIIIAMLLPHRPLLNFSLSLVIMAFRETMYILKLFFLSLPKRISDLFRIIFNKYEAQEERILIILAINELIVVPTLLFKVASLNILKMFSFIFYCYFLILRYLDSYHTKRVLRKFNNFMLTFGFPSFIVSIYKTIKGGLSRVTHDLKHQFENGF
ncbi:transmembrane protein [Anaeramoeba flamelloides]|uniref:Transmembrane protein n=1 Tax=Anaeramoeba flamelloides TaxID=1746091 RepID=A0AAV7ZU64_9EUKA|nr:transmembrane protein [Anaeramoeba flamelloides]